jgi:hypothetical protein
VARLPRVAPTAARVPSGEIARPAPAPFLSRILTFSRPLKRVSPRRTPSVVLTQTRWPARDAADLADGLAAVQAHPGERHEPDAPPEADRGPRRVGRDGERARFRAVQVDGAGHRQRRGVDHVDGAAAGSEQPCAVRRERERRDRAGEVDGAGDGASVEVERDDAPAGGHERARPVGRGRDGPGRAAEL